MKVKVKHNTTHGFAVGTIVNVYKKDWKAEGDIIECRGVWEGYNTRLLHFRSDLEVLPEMSPIRKEEKKMATQEEAKGAFYYFEHDYNPSNIKKGDVVRLVKNVDDDIVEVQVIYAKEAPAGERITCFAWRLKLCQPMDTTAKFKEGRTYIRLEKHPSIRVHEGDVFTGMNDLYVKSSKGEYWSFETDKMYEVPGEIVVKEEPVETREGFKVGDILIGKPDNIYVVTNARRIVKVIEIGLDYDYIRVKVINGHYKDSVFSVSPNEFMLYSPKEAITAEKARIKESKAKLAKFKEGFKVGDILVGKPGNSYSITGPGVKVKVIEVNATSNLICVKVMEGGATDREFNVSPKEFMLYCPETTTEAITAEKARIKESKAKLAKLTKKLDLQELQSLIDYLEPRKYSNISKKIFNRLKELKGLKERE